MPVRHYRFLRPAGAQALVALAGFFTVAGLHAQQVVLTNTRGLDFGRFAAGSGGTVAIAANGTRSRSGGVVLLNSPTAGQAAFSVGRSGTGTGKVVTITLPPNGTIQLSSGSNSMAVNTFVHAPSLVIVPPAGSTTLSVGATLSVAPNQPPGTYAGSFPLTVNFQ